MAKKKAKKPTSLFSPIVPDARLHEKFKVALTKGYAPARHKMSALFKEYHDKDGNFIEQFQTTGFDSRTWELYLFAYIKDKGFEIDNNFTSPDFVLSKDGKDFCIEAVTTNPTQGTVAELSPDDDGYDFWHQHSEYIPIKYGSSLYSKLNKKYWELAHVKSKPIILALECFHHEGPFYEADSALVTYLYGLDFKWFYNERGKLVVENTKRERHSHGEKTIPSGFFYLPNAENISAVLFSNSGTIAKFNRMGFQSGKYPSIHHMTRIGTCYDQDPNSTVPKTFEYRVGLPRWQETWGQGLILLTNPNALVPIDTNLFNDIPHGKIQNNNYIVNNMPAFHPFSSTTQIQAI